GGPADGADATRIRPVTAAAPESVSGVRPARGAGGMTGRASPRCTRDAPLGPRRSPPRHPIPAAVRRHVWLRDGGRCRYRDPLTGRRCNSSHLLQIHHLLPVAEGGGPEPENLALACQAHHRMCHGYGPAPTLEPWM
ncbi:MAG: HNH endonuclease, partial [Spirochaetaceae bacterium]|nr:HNH endonuclease [Spirochaetaceae bacterium]